MTDKGKVRRSSIIDQDKMGITFQEHYGTVTEGDVEVIRSEHFSMADFNDEVMADILIHGFKQKIGDCTASMGQDKGHTTDQRFEAQKELFAQMDGEKGQFNKAAKGGKSAANKADLAMAATMRARYNHSDTPEVERQILAGLLNIEYKAL